MIDFANIERYRENNRIEAKKALGGLPHSIWETYSAFANTLGGVILLGVEEYRDKSLHPVDLPDPERLVREFWEIAGDAKRVSVNVLTREHVRIENADGCRIIAITVPRAQRTDKPVYVEGNPFTGTYRRSGEGDYRCTREEVEGMQRDAAVRTQDMRLLDTRGLDALVPESIARYRLRLERLRPELFRDAETDAALLCRLGAAGVGADGAPHPTAAGLLMFGKGSEIVREFPGFLLDYQECPDGSARCTARIVSSSGLWSGNVFDFFCAVSDRIAPDGAAQDVPVCEALREALVNALIHADYRSRQGVTVVRGGDRIVLSNPGAFRIAVETAQSGGVSDPRNAALARMFNYINVGEGEGCGIPNLYALWKERGWEPPVIGESFSPDRITLLLSMRPAGCGKQQGNHAALDEIRKAAVIDYLTDCVTAGVSGIAGLLGIGDAEAEALLGEMAASGTVEAAADGAYRLKA